MFGSGIRAGYRRTRWAALACAGVMVATLVATTATGGAAPSSSAAANQAAPDVTAGRASAIAYAMKLDPRAGNLSIGITLGTSVAGHQDTAAQASSQAIDLGSIGTSLAGQGCDGSAPTLPDDQQPHAVVVDTRNPDQPQTVDEDETFAPGFHKFVAVTSQPTADAVTTVAPMGIAALAQIGGIRSEAKSALVDGVRMAQATADVATLTIGGAVSALGIPPLVSLTNLHWQANYDSDQQPVGTFSIGAVTILGKSIPTQDPTAALAQVNQVLNRVGLNLDPPRTHLDQGIMFVDPLGLSVVPNSTRDALSFTVIKGIQPVREPLIDALLKAKCTLASEITVADIAVGAVTGAGSFNIFFGGAQASSGELPENSYKLGGFQTIGGNNGGSVLGTNSTNTLGGSSPSLGTSKPSSTPTPQSNYNQSAAPLQPASAGKSKGSRGGAMAGVGLGCLALLAAVAEADRRKMRRAQREIPLYA